MLNILTPCFSTLSTIDKKFFDLDNTSPCVNICLISFWPLASLPTWYLKNPVGLNLSVVGANSFLPLYTTHVLSLSSFIVFLLEPDFVVKPISLKLKNISSKYCCLSSNSIGLLSKACLSISNPFGLSSNKTPNISSAASLLATLSSYEGPIPLPVVPIFSVFFLFL